MDTRDLRQPRRDLSGREDHHHREYCRPAQRDVGGRRHSDQPSGQFMQHGRLGSPSPRPVRQPFPSAADEMHGPPNNSPGMNDYQDSDAASGLHIPKELQLDATIRDLKARLFRTEETLRHTEDALSLETSRTEVAEFQRMAAISQAQEADGELNRLRNLCAWFDTTLNEKQEKILELSDANAKLADRNKNLQLKLSSRGRERAREQSERKGKEIQRLNQNLEAARMRQENAQLMQQVVIMEKALRRLSMGEKYNTEDEDENSVPLKTVVGSDGTKKSCIDLNNPRFTKWMSAPNNAGGPGREPANHNANGSDSGNDSAFGGSNNSGSGRSGLRNGGPTRSQAYHSSSASGSGPECMGSQAGHSAMAMSSNGDK